jgi:hypothetical protein
VLPLLLVLLLLLSDWLRVVAVLPLLLVLLLLLSDWLRVLVVLPLLLVLLLLLSDWLRVVLVLLLSVELRVVLPLSVLFVLLLLFDEFMLLLLRSLLSAQELRSVFVVVVLVELSRVVLTVLPPRATTESSACALSEKASVIAVTSKVLFIRFPLWVCWLD